MINGTIKAPNGEAFTDVLWIGIGGSGLGPALMIKALQNPGEVMQLARHYNVRTMELSSPTGGWRFPLNNEILRS